jgi:hypothetical protein
LAYSTRSWLCSLYGEAEGTEFAALYLETEYLRPVEQGGLPGYLFFRDWGGSQPYRWQRVSHDYFPLQCQND